MRMMHRHHEGEQEGWIYFSSAEQTASPVLVARAARGQRAARTYSNDDVRRQNQQNGLVKYDSKTLKIQ